MEASFVDVMTAFFRGPLKPRVPYAAAFHIQQGDDVLQGRIHLMRDRARVEFEGEDASITIARNDLNLAWFIDPERGTYDEVAVRAAPKGSLELTPVGPEQRDGVDVTKYALSVRGTDVRGLAWLNDHNVVLAAEVDGALVSVRDVQVGAPPAAMFDLPQGLTRA